MLIPRFRDGLPVISAGGLPELVDENLQCDPPTHLQLEIPEFTAVLERQVPPGSGNWVFESQETYPGAVQTEASVPVPLIDAVRADFVLPEIPMCERAAQPNACTPRVEIERFQRSFGVAEVSMIILIEFPTGPVPLVIAWGPRTLDHACCVAWGHLESFSPIDLPLADDLLITGFVFRVRVLDDPAAVVTPIWV